MTSKTFVKFHCAGDVLVNEGSLYFAIMEISRAIEIMTNQVGEESQLVAKTYNKRGEVYRQQGKLQEALADQTKALELLQRIFGKDHPQTGQYKLELELPISSIFVCARPLLESS